FLILILGGRDVLLGAITVGTFVAFQRYVVQLSWPMEAIGWTVTMNREGIASYRRLNEILNAPKVDMVRRSSPRLSRKGNVLEVHNLRYWYPGAGGHSRGFGLELDELGI